MSKGYNDSLKGFHCSNLGKSEHQNDNRDECDESTMVLNKNKKIKSIFIEKCQLEMWKE